MKKHEIINVFTKLDALFGKFQPFHSAMFSMYGPFNHKTDVLFHNNTKTLATDKVLNMHPYDKIPSNFERGLTLNDCSFKQFSSGCNLLPSFFIILIGLVYFVISS